MLRGLYQSFPRPARLFHRLSGCALKESELRYRSRTGPRKGATLDLTVRWNARSVSRVIGFTAGKRTETILLSAVGGGCGDRRHGRDHRRASPWQYFTPRARERERYAKNLFVRDLAYGESLLNIGSGIKESYKGACKHAVQEEGTCIHTWLIVKRTGLPVHPHIQTRHAYKLLRPSLSRPPLSTEGGQGEPGWAAGKINCAERKEGRRERRDFIAYRLCRRQSHAPAHCN